MKRVDNLIAVLTLLLMFSIVFGACISSKNQSTSNKNKATNKPVASEEKGESSTRVSPSVAKLGEVAGVWSQLKKAYEPNRDRDGTWLQEGFRSKYAMVKKYASLKMLEQAFGAPVFLSGPHTGDMNFNDKTNFGHYNPKFIAQLSEALGNALKDPTRKSALRKVYTKDVESMARTYREAYRYVNDGNVNAFQKEYQKAMANGEGSMQEFFRDYADNGYYSDAAEAAEAKRTNPDRNWYEAVTAPSFWVRRSMDGTGKQLFDVLDMVIKEMEK